LAVWRQSTLDKARPDAQSPWREWRWNLKGGVHDPSNSNNPSRMKQCTWCGKQYPDDADVCPLDGKTLGGVDDEQAARSSSPAPESDEMVTAKETQFWEEMNFKKFAALLLRLQALWLLFYAVVDATHLVPYFRVVAGAWSFSAMSAGFKLEFFLLILRIALHVAAAVAVIQNAERLLSWLVKDWVKKQPAKSEARPPS